VLALQVLLGLFTIWVMKKIVEVFRNWMDDPVAQRLKEMEEANRLRAEREAAAAAAQKKGGKPTGRQQAGKNAHDEVGAESAANDDGKKSAAAASLRARLRHFWPMVSSEPQWTTSPRLRRYRARCCI